MKDFSLFEFASKVAEATQTQDMGTVNCLSRQELNAHETIRFRAPLPCLEYVSLIIETAVLLRTNRTGRFYVGFQKLSRMEPVADRFLRIADLSERVYVFAEQDWKPPRHPHMKLVKLNGSATLAREWFVIVDSSTLKIAFVSRDEDGSDVPNPDRRVFTALKSHNADLVNQLAAAAEKLACSTGG